MKILHVVRGLANSSGTTHIVLPLAEEQARHGHDVSVWHIAKPDRGSLEPDPRLVNAQCFKTSWPPTQHLGWSLPFLRAASRHTDAFDVLHVHAVWNMATLGAVWAALRTGTPVVVAPQGSFDPLAWDMGSSLRKVYAKSFELPILMRATAFQALSVTEVEQIEAMGYQGRVEIIPNGVSGGVQDDNANVSDLRDELGIPAGVPVILYLGRLHRKKGVDLLVRATARVAAHQGPVALVIAGTDAGSGYAKELRTLVAKSRAGNVHFIGEVAGAKKRAALAGADVFALASHSEGQPIAALEAMASGLPVVLTKACHIPEAVAAGYVVDATEASITDALDGLLKRKADWPSLGQAAKDIASAKFSWAAIATRCVSLYTELAEGHTQ